MPIKFNSNNRVLNSNARAVDVAKDTIDRILPIQARRAQAAFRTQGFQCALYHPLTGGIRCACVGKRQIVASILDEQGNAKPGFINELLTGEQFDIAPYGSMPATNQSLSPNINQSLNQPPVRNAGANVPGAEGSGIGVRGPSAVPAPGWLTNPATGELLPGSGSNQRGGSSVELIYQNDDGEFVYASRSGEHAPADPRRQSNPNYQTPSVRTGTSGTKGNGTVGPMPYADTFPGAYGNVGTVAGGQGGVADEESAFDWVQRNVDHFGCSDQYGPDGDNTGHAQHKKDSLLGPMTSYSDVYSSTHQDPRARTIVPVELGSNSSGASKAVQPPMQPPSSTLPDLDAVFDPADPDDANPTLPEVPHDDYKGDPYGNPLPTFGITVGDPGAAPTDPANPNKPGVVGSDLPRLDDYPLPVQTGTATVPGKRPTPIVSHTDADTFEELTGTYDNPNADAEIEEMERALMGEAGQAAQRQAGINGAVDASLMTSGGDALAALSDAKCPVCFGHGYVGGYRLYNGWRNVQSVATQPTWLGDYEVNWQAEIPYVSNCNGVQFSIVLPVNCVAVDAFNVRNGKEVVPADLFVDDRKLGTERDLARFCDGRRHTVRVVTRRPTTITHVEIQVNQSREWVLFEFPRVTRTSAVDVIDTTGQVTVNAPPMIADIRPRCVFVESTYGKPFLVLDVPTWNDRRRSILGWSFEARVLQPTELASYLPKRLQIESQNRLVQVRDNGPGFARRT